LTVSCSQNSVVNTTESIEGKLWNVNDVKQIDFEVTDTVAGYDFHLLVRNNNDYPYRNIHLLMSLVLPNSKVAVDTLHIDLANKEGKWLGEGVSNQHNNEILYKKNQRFPMSGKYQVRIEHAMREKDLPGITDVGLSIRNN